MVELLQLRPLQSRQHAPRDHGIGPTAAQHDPWMHHVKVSIALETLNPPLSPRPALAMHLPTGTQCLVDTGVSRASPFLSSHDGEARWRAKSYVSMEKTWRDMTNAESR